MRPFLLLATRPEDLVADAEYEEFCRYGGLEEDELFRVRLEETPLREALHRVDLDDWSGVILGGGPFNSSDPEDRKSPLQRRCEAELGQVLDQAVARGTPLLGACYGVGTLGTRYGGVVDREHGEDVQATQVTLTPAGAADPLLADAPVTFDAFVGHKEACRVLPRGAVLLATSPTCPVQMFRIGPNAYATQFHPELDTDGLIGRVRAYKHEGYFPAETVEEVVASVRGLEVTVPQRILRRFVERHARP